MLAIVQGGAHEAPSLAEALLAVDVFCKKENHFSLVIYLLVSCPFPSKYNSIPIHTHILNTTLIKSNRFLKNK